MRQFNRWWVSTGILTMSSFVALLSLILSAPSASAQAAYGSYVGFGLSTGLTEGDTSVGEDQTNAGDIAFRYKFLKAPVSIRTQVLVFNPTTAVIPTISYDFPLNWYTDAYIGAGYSFSQGHTDEPSPLGNKDAFVIQPGIDFVIPNSSLVLFGNAIFAFDAYKEGGDTAVSIQTGVGLRLN